MKDAALDKDPQSIIWVNTKALFVKLSGMRKKEGIREEGKRLEKERGKEDKK